jgi:hypothetical protein
MNTLRSSVLCLSFSLIFAIYIGSLIASGQTQPRAPKPAKKGGQLPTQPATSSTGQQSPAPAAPSLQSRIAADVIQSRDVGDYIPCEFSRVDLLNLRPRPEVYVLTDADEDILRSRIITEALNNDNASAFPENTRDLFVKDVGAESFVGLTASQATGKILYLLGRDTAPPKVKEIEEAASGTNKTFAEFLQNISHSQINSKEAINVLGSEELAPQAKLSAAMKLAESKLATAKPDDSALLAAAHGTNQDFAQYVGKTFKLDVAPALGNTEQSPESKLDVTSAVAQSKGQTNAQATVKDAEALNSAANLKTTASQALTQPPARSQVAQAAQQVTAALARPLDVACSMSIFSYETTRYAFGQRMADEFIPVQIVVRNLNENKEFLVQDAQFAVDEDINGRIGKYAAGIDKLTARTFMLSSRDYSRRNLVVHLAQGIGTVLSSASLVYGTAVKDAANVYSAGFLNALTGVWTDHGTDHLNLLNDEGFSSYRTERTVVPKSGTAEFVIFLRSDQFQEGWWVQHCADNIIIKNPDHFSQLNSRQSAKCIGQMNLQSPDPKCIANTEISVDLEAVRKVCLHYYKSPDNRSVDVCDANGTCEPKLVDVGPDQKEIEDKKNVDVKGDFAYFKPNLVRYKDWRPTSVALFRELSLAVIAGTHIQEQKDTTPGLTKIDCPVDDKGDIDFDKAENGTITCTLSGSNLDQVQTLKLRNAADATDTKIASGTVTTTTNGSSKTTKTVFTLDVLGALPAKVYKVYTVTKDGIESGGDQLIHLASGQPYLPANGKPDPNTLNLADLLGKNGKPISITLKGFHLDNLQAVRFVKSANDTTGAVVTTFDVPVDSGSNSTQAQITIKPDDAKKVNVTGSSTDFTTKKLELSILLISKDAPNSPFATKQVIYGTGNLPSTPPIAPATKPAPANAKKPAAASKGTSATHQ